MTMRSTAAHETFFPMVPTTGPDGLGGTYAQMNLRDVYARVRLQPRPTLVLSGEVHGLSLATPFDRWYSGTGATALRGDYFGYSVRSSRFASGLGTYASGGDRESHPTPLDAQGLGRHRQGRRGRPPPVCRRVDVCVRAGESPSHSVGHRTGRHRPGNFGLRTAHFGLRTSDFELLEELDLDHLALLRRCRSARGSRCSRRPATST